MSRPPRNSKGRVEYWTDIYILKPFDPEVIVIGGGVMERRGFLQRLQASFRVNGLECKIRRARLGKNGVAVGAALLFSD